MFHFPRAEINNPDSNKILSFGDIFSYSLYQVLSSGVTINKAPLTRELIFNNESNALSPGKKISFQ